MAVPRFGRQQSSPIAPRFSAEAPIVAYGRRQARPTPAPPGAHVPPYRVYGRDVHRPATAGLTAHRNHESRAATAPRTVPARHAWLLVGNSHHPRETASL